MAEIKINTDDRKLKASIYKCTRPVINVEFLANLSEAFKHWCIKIEYENGYKMYVEADATASIKSSSSSDSASKPILRPFIFEEPPSDFDSEELVSVKEISPLQVCKAVLTNSLNMCTYNAISRNCQVWCIEFLELIESTDSLNTNAGIKQKILTGVSSIMMKLGSLNSGVSGLPSSALNASRPISTAMSCSVKTGLENRTLKSTMKNALEVSANTMPLVGSVAEKIPHPATRATAIVLCACGAVAARVAAASFLDENSENSDFQNLSDALNTTSTVLNTVRTVYPAIETLSTVVAIGAVTTDVISNYNQNSKSEEIALVSVRNATKISRTN